MGKQTGLFARNALQPMGCPPSVTPQAFVQNGFACSNRILPFPVVLCSKPDDATPSLQSRYGIFFTTTGCSAPVLRIGTLPLVGLPLVVLPLHRSDRFPRSTQEPESSSRHLHAGGRLTNKQVTARLVPE